jgi:hypothetical protein
MEIWTAFTDQAWNAKLVARCGPDGKIIDVPLEV